MVRVFGSFAMRHHAIDGIGARGDAFFESLREEARFVGRHDLGDRAVEVHRIDDGGAETFQVGDRLVGDANAVAIGEGCFDHEFTHHAQAFAGQGFFVGIISVRHGLLAVRHRGDMITRVGAGDDFEHRRGVLHGAAHRSAAVARE